MSDNKKEKNNIGVEIYGPLGSVKKIIDNLNKIMLIPTPSYIEDILKTKSEIARLQTSPIIEMKKIIQKHVDDLYDISAPLQRLAKMQVFSPDFEETDLFPHIEEFSIGLEDVEETLDIIDAEVANEISPELKQNEMRLILEQQKSFKSGIAELRAEVNAIKELINTKTLPDKIKTKRGPNEASKDKVKRLAEYRMESLKDRGVIPGWIASCNIIGIDPKTVRNIAPELREKGEDKDYTQKDNKEK